MSNFLERLYSYEYFGVYLMVAISVLVLLFIIVLFYGKKDKKEREIEATKKLQLEQVKNEANNNELGSVDAFKEENNLNKVEVNVENSLPEINNSNLEADTIVMPTIDMPNENSNENLNDNLSNNSTDSLNEEIKDIKIENNMGINDMVNKTNSDSLEEIKPVEVPNVELPKVEEAENIFPEINVNEPSISEPVLNVDNSVLEPKPILEKEEETPLVFNNTENEVDDEPTAVFSKIEVPEFNFDAINEVPELNNNPEPLKQEEHSEPARNLEVFSSVYANEREELPELEIPEVDEVVDFNNDNDLPDVPTDEEMEMELPTLKKEYEEETFEKPQINDYNLNDLSGETYNINN